MTVSDFLLMRFEIILIGIILIILIAEIFAGENHKKEIIWISVTLFGLATITGFLPIPEGKIFGNSFFSNPLISIMKNILNLAVFIILLQSVSWLKKEENQGKVSEFFILIFSTLTGMYFMISSNNFLMMYIGMELASIPLAALAAYDKNSSKSAEAGIKFILLSALASGIMLFGLSFIYGITGSLSFSDAGALAPSAALSALGFVFFFSGMAFKISLVPFHLWTADVYEGSPISVTSYLSVVSKGATLFILAITLYKVFFSIGRISDWLIYTLAITTMTVGNLFAMRQNNLKRFLAFSSIAQSGFIMVGIMGFRNMGMTAMVYFVLIYVFSNLAAFGVVSSVYHHTGKENINDYKGLYHTNPLLSLTMLLAVFSLAGIPPLAGFFGKFFLFTSAAGKGYYVLILVAVLNATLSLYYYLKVVKAMFIDTSENPIPTFRSDTAARAGMLICVAGICLTGFAGVVFDFIMKVSAGMFGQ